MRSAVQELKALAKFVVLWVTILVVGILVLLIAVSAAGYLPYSDRPGPSWGPRRIPSLEQITYFLSWATFFLAPALACWGCGLFVIVRSLGYFGAPLLLIRLSGAIFCAYAALLMTAAAGWYIALAATPIYAAGILGFVLGALLLPRFRGTARIWPNKAVRAGGIIVILLASLGFVTYPFWPKAERPQLEVHVVRVGPGTQPVMPVLGLTDVEANSLRHLDLRGVLHGGIQVFTGTGGGRRIRIYILSRGPITSPLEFRQPESSYVIYLQNGLEWDHYPANVVLTGEKIQLRPTSEKNKDAEILVPGPAGWSSFAWSPPVSNH